MQSFYIGKYDAYGFFRIPTCKMAIVSKGKVARRSVFVSLTTARSGRHSACYCLSFQSILALLNDVLVAKISYPASNDSVINKK